MKKIFFSLLTLTSILIATQNSDAQVVEEGDVIVDAHYGFPNLFTALLKASYANSGSEENVELRGIGPLGVRGEYMVTDDIGIGLEINYSNTSISYDDQTTNSEGEIVTYNYKISVPRMRIMPRFNFHFGDSEDFDFYSALAAGYNSFSFKFETDDPDNFNEEIDSLLPVAFRVAIGGRYFFSDNVGLNLEIGLGGGAIIAGGLSIKL